MSEQIEMVAPYSGYCKTHRHQAYPAASTGAGQCATCHEYWDGVIEEIYERLLGFSLDADILCMEGVGCYEEQLKCGCEVCTRVNLTRPDAIKQVIDFIERIEV